MGNVVLDHVTLDAATVAAQKAALAARARGAKIFLSILGVGLVASFLASYQLSLTGAGNAALGMFLLLGAALFAAVYFGSNWWQWRVMQVYALRCPHCNELLADSIHLLRAPNFFCPHCGKEALATSRELAAADTPDTPPTT